MMPRTTTLVLRTPKLQFPVVPPEILPTLGQRCGFCRCVVHAGDTHGVWDGGAFVCTITTTVYDPAPESLR